MNLNLWHAGSENVSGKARKVIMINIKRISLPQLLNYKKFLKKTKDSLNEVEKYLLAVRKVDKTQKSDSTGVGKYYRQDFMPNNNKKYLVNYLVSYCTRKSNFVC